MDRITVLEESGIVSFSINYSNGSDNSLNLNYVGESNLPSFELKEKEKILNRMFAEGKGIFSLEKLVHHIKIVFRDVKEKELSISTSYKSYDGKFVDSCVAYNDGDLYLYSIQKDSSLGKLSFEYLKGSGIRYNSLGKDLLDLDFEGNKEFTHFIDWEKQCLISFKNNANANVSNKKYSFSYGIESMCRAYRRFYKENPDFSKDLCKLKAQAMVMILDSYGYNVAGLEYGFTSYGSLPYNAEFSKYCYELEPYGRLKESMCGGDYFSASEEESIRRIGDVVISSLKRVKGHEEERLKNLITVFHAKNKVFSSRTSNDTKLYADRYKIDEKEVNECLTLIGKVNKIK